MNRRTFLATLSGGVLTGLAGCNALPFSDADPTPTPTADEPTDSDLDGVPDEDDYAPWDNDVQNKSDVLDEYWGTALDSTADDVSPTAEMFGRSPPPTARAISLVPGADAPRSLSMFLEYSPARASIRVRQADRSDAPHRVLVVARKFPRRGVIGTAQSDVLGTSGDVRVDVEFDQRLASNEVVYLSAFVVPDVPLDDLEMGDVTYLHETNPFRIKSEAVAPASTDYELDRASDDGYVRVPVEGGYAIALTGRTNGHDWDISYFVSRSAYERKRLEPRGRSREEYARYARSNGTGDQFVDIVRNAATDAGFSTRAEQVKFAIDMVQSLPYVLDSVGSGFDDYTKFIEETMTDLQGDCEDSTVALAIILTGLGFDVVTVEFPSHIGIGLAGDYEGSYILYEGTQYYYVETTGEGWSIGDIPQSLDTSEVQVRAV